MSDLIPLTLKEQYDDRPPHTDEWEKERSAVWAEFEIDELETEIEFLEQSSDRDRPIDEIRGRKDRLRQAVEKRAALINQYSAGAIDQHGPHATPVVESGATPWHLLATSAQLIDAFGKYTGMDKAWFNNAKDTPGLKAALHTAGKSGRGGREPLYYVMPVMLWLANPKRRKGRSMEQATGWRALEHKFPKVYEEYLGQKPDTE